MDADVCDPMDRNDDVRSRADAIGGHHSARGWMRVALPRHALFLFVLLFSWPAPASGSYSEEAVKSAYLYNFARYVEWPETTFAGPEAPLMICVIGDPEFSQIASQGIGSRTVGEHTLQVDDRNGLDDSAGCHIVYVPESAGIADAAVIGALSARSVFTVSDSADFARRGGIANFIRVNRKIRFEINPDAADRAGLKVRARLLRVAKVIS